ncbi:MAG: peptide MFS transporter, partial [Steroidobacterales bacterium]
MNSATDAVPVSPAPGPLLFGQPRGLATLFLTEMWERFTYYGIQSVLILFMVAAVSRGGLGLDDKTSSSIFGLFLGSTYLLGLFGGWIADRLLGAQRAVISGGILIAAGSVLLAIGNQPLFFLGLLVNAMGVGLLKPNVSAIVASLYPEGGARRDAGFSIFYMGINIGGTLGSFFVPVCAAAFGWRPAFALPALFMTLGVAQFLWTRSYLGSAGLQPAHERRGSWTPVVVFLAAIAVIVILALTRTLTLNATVLLGAATWGYGLLALAYFVYLLFFAGLTAA